MFLTNITNILYLKWLSYFFKNKKRKKTKEKVGSAFEINEKKEKNRTEVVK